MPPCLAPLLCWPVCPTTPSVCAAAAPAPQWLTHADASLKHAQQPCSTRFTATTQQAWGPVPIYKVRLVCLDQAHPPCKARIALARAVCVVPPAADMPAPTICTDQKSMQSPQHTCKCAPAAMFILFKYACAAAGAFSKHPRPPTHPPGVSPGHFFSGGGLLTCARQPCPPFRRYNLQEGRRQGSGGTAG
jgi:hypothetical protein